MLRGKGVTDAATAVAAGHAAAAFALDMTDRTAPVEAEGLLLNASISSTRRARQDAPAVCERSPETRQTAWVEASFRFQQRGKVVE